MTFTTWSCSIARSLITPLPGLDVLQAAESWCRCICKRKTQWSVIVSVVVVVSMFETCFLAATFVKVFKMSVRSCDEEWFVFDSKQTWLEFFTTRWTVLSRSLAFLVCFGLCLLPCAAQNEEDTMLKVFGLLDVITEGFLKSVCFKARVLLYMMVLVSWRNDEDIKFTLSEGAGLQRLSSVHISSSMDRILCTFTHIYIYIHIYIYLH